MGKIDIDFLAIRHVHRIAGNQPDRCTHKFQVYYFVVTLVLGMQYFSRKIQVAWFDSYLYGLGFETQLEIGFARFFFYTIQLRLGQFHQCGFRVHMEGRALERAVHDVYRRVVDQFSDDNMVRIFQKIIRHIDLMEYAFRYYTDSVCHGYRAIVVVSNIKNSGLIFFMEFLELNSKFFPKFQVKIAERFIKKVQARFSNKCSCQRNTLSFAHR